MRNKINQIHPIQIRTISPVSIGNGNKKSPLSDFYIDQQRLYYINKKAFEEVLKKDEAILEKYIDGIQRNKDYPKNSFLKDFVQNEMQDNLNTYFDTEPIEVSGVRNAVELFSIIRNGEEPYISGSTIKGAIKTAILYDWLINDSRGRYALEGFKRDIAAGKWWRDLDFNYNKNIEWKVFGKMGNRRMEYSLFKVRDSQPLPKTEVGVFHAQRYHLVGESSEKNQQIPFLKEAILPHLTTDFELLIADNTLEQVQNFFLRKVAKDINVLFRTINQFSKDNLERELTSVKKEVRQDRLADLADYFTFLENRKVEVDDVKSNENRAFMRLGSGKNYFYNAMSLALFNRYQYTDPEVLVKFRKAYKLGQRKRNHPDSYWKGLFPRTRTIITHDLSEFGWVEISKK